MATESFQDVVQIDENPWTFLHAEWNRRRKNDALALVPSLYLERHIALAEINDLRYVRFKPWTYIFDLDGLSLSIPASSPWFCLDLANLVSRGQYEEAREHGFMLCPECGSNDFVHRDGQNWFEDECKQCCESWHAIGYSWINVLVGTWMLDYGNFLSS